MTVEVSTRAFRGGRQVSDGQGKPDLKTMLRQVCDDLAALSTRNAGLQVAFDALVVKYNLHIGTSGVHKEEDLENTLAAPVATVIETDILALLNAAKAQHNLHIVMVGSSEHTGADVTNPITAADATDEATAATLYADIRTQVLAHFALIGATGHTAADDSHADPGAATDWDDMSAGAILFKSIMNSHMGITNLDAHDSQDVTNTSTAADMSDLASGYTLADELEADMTAHFANATAHTNADDETTVSFATPNSEGTLVAAVNLLKDAANDHFANLFDSGSDPIHGTADAVNVVVIADCTNTATAQTLINDIKAKWNLHLAVLALVVHGAADATNVIATADSGVQIAAAFVQANELKDNGNTHIASEGYHPLAGTAEGTADATTEATFVALANALKATHNTHFSSAEDHLAAGSASVTAADITEYEDALPLVADLVAQFGPHILVKSVHTGADAANSGSALGTGAAPTIGLVKGA